VPTSSDSGHVSVVVPAVPCLNCTPDSQYCEPDDLDPHAQRRVVAAEVSFQATIVTCLSPCLCTSCISVVDRLPSEVRTLQDAAVSQLQLACSCAHYLFLLGLFIRQRLSPFGSHTTTAISDSLEGAAAACLST
jgi:hypothetical protein